MIGAATPLQDILEKDWQRDALKLAQTLGWVSYHTFNSQRSAHGFPDACLVREGDRHLFLEFKRETTKLTEQQRTWLRLLLSAGAEAYVARPHDLDDLALILAGRLTGKATGWLMAAARMREATEKEASQ